MIGLSGFTTIKKNLSNIPGWSTKKKLIVLESDDWGSIRMPSLKAYERLSELRIDLSADDGYRFNRYDTIATADDLECLFEVLSSVKDANRNNIVITPVSVVANPVFDMIRESGFSEYFYEPLPVTFNRYPGCERSFDLWLEGIEKRLFIPQFHGREHLNVMVWMSALRSGHQRTLQAFDNGLWGISTASDPAIQVEFQAAFDFNDPMDLSYHKDIIISGLKLFNSLFGYHAVYFVPPNNSFNTGIENICFENGIRILSVAKFRLEPMGNGKYGKRIHWTGQKGKSGLTYLCRNCLFEPGIPGRNWTDSCLKEISSAFKWQKPAVISSHRVNFIGALDIKNRDNGLKALSELLKAIMRHWPEAEFITTAELYEIMSNK